MPRPRAEPVRQAWPVARRKAPMRDPPAVMFYVERVCGCGLGCRRVSAFAAGGADHVAHVAHGTVVQNPTATGRRVAHGCAVMLLMLGVAPGGVAGGPPWRGVGRAAPRWLG